jgi:hypothetical protein
LSQRGLHGRAFVTREFAFRNTSSAR